MFASRYITIGLASLGLAVVTSTASGTESDGFELRDQAQYSSAGSQYPVDPPPQLNASEDTVTPTDGSGSSSGTPPKKQAQKGLVHDEGCGIEMEVVVETPDESPNPVAVMAAGSGTVGEGLTQTEKKLTKEQFQLIYEFIHANYRDVLPKIGADRKPVIGGDGKRVNVKGDEQDKSGNFPGLGGIPYEYYDLLARMLKGDKLWGTLTKWQTLSSTPENIASFLVSLLPGVEKQSRKFFPWNTSEWIKGAGTRQLIYGARAFVGGIFSAISLTQSGIFWGFCLYQVIYSSPFNFWSIFDIINGKEDSGVDSLIHLLVLHPESAIAIGGVLGAIPILKGGFDGIRAQAVGTEVPEEGCCSRHCCSCCKGEKLSEVALAVKALEKSTQKDRGYTSILFRDGVAPFLALPFLDPTGEAVDTLARLILWDNHCDDPKVRSNAFLALQKLSDKGHLFARLRAIRALIDIASGVNFWQQQKFADKNPMNPFVITEAELRLRAGSGLLEWGTPTVVWRKSKGFLETVGNVLVVCPYTILGLWRIGLTPSIGILPPKVLSAGLYAYSIGMQVLGYKIIQTFVDAWARWKACPNVQVYYDFKIAGIPPAFLDFSQLCLNAFLKVFNVLFPGQPASTLVKDLSKFRVANMTIFNLTENCAANPIKAIEIAGLLDGFKVAQPGVNFTVMDLSGCDLSDRNGTAALGISLANQTALKSLRMSHCHIESDTPAPELLGSIGKLNLTSLDLSKNAIRTTGAQALILPASVTHLDLSTNPAIGDGLRQYLITRICGLTGLEYLDISGAGSASPMRQGIECLKSRPLKVLKASDDGYPSDIVAIGDALPASLLELDVSGGCSNQTAVTYLVSRLPSGLKSLKMAGLMLESAGDSNGTLALAQHMPSTLEVLDITACQIGLAGDSSADTLLGAIPTTVQDLTFESNSLTKVLSLQPALTSGNLKKINFKWNQLQDPAQIDALIPALKQAQVSYPAVEIDVSWNAIGQTPLANETLEAMGEVFQSTTTTLFPQTSAIPADQLEPLCTHINTGRPLSQVYLLAPGAVDDYFSRIPASTTTLNLSGMLKNADAATLAQVMAKLKTLPNLINLDLSGNSFGIDDSLVTAIATGGLPSTLQSLNLSGNALGTRGTLTATPNLMTALGVLTDLTDLNLEGNLLRLFDVQALKPSLMSFVKLRILNLSKNTFLNVQSHVEIAQSLAALKDLTTLKLSDTKFCAGGVAGNDTTAYTAVFPLLTKLQDLDVSTVYATNYIEPNVIAVLPPSVTEIKFVGSVLSMGAAEAMAARFPALTALTSVDFTRVEGPGAVNLTAGLAQAFQGGWAPTTISVSTLNIGSNPGDLAFAQSLPPTLEALDVSNNPNLESSGTHTTLIKAIGDSLVRMHNITSLNLWSTGLGSTGTGEGFAALGAGLTNKTSFKSGDFSGNTFVDTPDANAGLQQLLAAIAPRACGTFTFSSVPAGAWLSNGTQAGALDAQYAKEIGIITGSCQGELCFGTPVVVPPRCDNGTEISVSVSSAGSRSSGILIDAIEGIKGAVRSLFGYKEPELSFKTMLEEPATKAEPFPDFLSQMQVEELTEESSPPVDLTALFIEQQPTSWWGRIVDSLGDGLANLVGDFARDIVEGSPSYFHKDYYLYGSQLPRLKEGSSSTGLAQTPLMMATPAPYMIGGQAPLMIAGH